MSDKAVLCEISDGLARITLARPESGNSIGLDAGRELMEAAIACDEDARVRAVLLQSSAPVFCVGGDLKYFAGTGDQVGAALKELTVYLHAAISRFSRMEKPLVTAVNGAAAGAGFSLAVLGDIVLASDAAKFTMAYTRIGLSPDGGASYLLPRLIGLRRTQELMLTNRTLSAAEAADWGLVTRVVAADDLATEAEAVAASLATGPTRAYGAVKRLLLQSVTNTLETQMEIESREIAATAMSDDGFEGLAAFLDKRAPQFSGR